MRGTGSGVPSTKVVSSSGKMHGTMYWSSCENTFLLIFNDPLVPRRRLKRRAANACEAVEKLDDFERSTAEVAASRSEPSERTRFLTQDEQLDAFSAIRLLKGSMTLTEAALAVVSQKEPSIWRDEKGEADVPVYPEMPIELAVKKFLRYKAEGRMASTVLTYGSRLQKLVSAGNAVPANKALLRDNVRAVASDLSPSSAYSLFTSVSSLQQWMNRHCDFGYPFGGDIRGLVESLKKEKPNEKA